MSSQTVADLLVARLDAAGVQPVFDVVGDGLNGITDAITRDVGHVGHRADQPRAHQHAVRFFR